MKPKVAVISLGSYDYLVDIVTDGLIRELGRENVHLHYKITHMGGDIRYTHLAKGFFDRPNSFGLYEADALVISTRSGLAPLQEWVSRTGKKTVGVLDGNDDVHLIPELQAAAKIYFKREHFGDRQYPGNVRPLPFAALPEEPSARAPEIERMVFFMGHNGVPARAEIAARLRHMGWPASGGGSTKEHYNRLLRGSLVAVSVRGFGWDTYRYWEIPYFGACLLSERLPITIPKNFVDGEEAVFFTGPDEFQEKLAKLLLDPQEGIRIAANGKKAAMERHLSIHRARSVLTELL